LVIPEADIALSSTQTERLKIYSARLQLASAANKQCLPNSALMHFPPKQTQFKKHLTYARKTIFKFKTKRNAQLSTAANSHTSTRYRILSKRSICTTTTAIGRSIYSECITAAPGFRVFATMNHGGDLGKQELSPAMSNRFTKTWICITASRSESGPIISSCITADVARISSEY
jgi:hypothetical protein